MEKVHRCFECVSCGRWEEKYEVQRQKKAVWSVENCEIHAPDA